MRHVNSLRGSTFLHGRQQQNPITMYLTDVAMSDGMPRSSQPNEMDRLTG